MCGSQEGAPMCRSFTIWLLHDGACSRSRLHTRSQKPPAEFVCLKGNIYPAMVDLGWRSIPIFTRDTKLPSTSRPSVAPGPPGITSSILDIQVVRYGGLLLGEGIQIPIIWKHGWPATRDSRQMLIKGCRVLRSCCQVSQLAMQRSHHHIWQWSSAIAHTSKMRQHLCLHAHHCLDLPHSTCSSSASPIVFLEIHSWLALCCFTLIAPCGFLD